MNKSSLKQKLIGVWRIVSSVNILSEQEVFHVFGENPRGYLLYTAEGFMSVQIMRREWADIEEVLENTDLAQKLISENYLAYSGNYEVDDEQQIVTHHVEMSVTKDRLGKSLRRRIKLEGNRLILEALDIPGVHVITWERVT